jgi:signal transduction histidine kinase
VNKLNRSIASPEKVWEQEELKLVQEAAGVAFWDFDPNTKECSWSKETFLLMGQDPATFNPTYENFLECVHPDDRRWVDAAVRTAVRRGTEYNIQFRIVLPDRSTRWVAARGRLICRSGVPVRMMGVVMDITQRRLAVSGQLVAATAHELKNPLATMFNVLYLLRQNPSLDNAAHARLDCLHTELKRMQVIVDQTLGMYRESASPREVNLSELLDTIVEFYKPKIGYKHIAVQKRYACSGLIEAVPSEMQQVFTNIVVNALEAVAPGGKLIIHLYASPKWDESRREGFRVVVADNGPGIQPEERRTIFEPLFTTKGDKGSGLGLWVAQGMINKYGGLIRMHSSVQPGKSGTVFSVFLPDGIDRIMQQEAVNDS